MKGSGRTGDLPIAPIASTRSKAAASSTAGFFQTPPKLQNQFHDDGILRRVVDLYIPATLIRSLTPDLVAFGGQILTPQIFSWIADAERNPPYLRTWDVWGKRRDELVTSEGWRNLQSLGIQEGIVAIAYEEEWGLYARLYQMLKYHLWSGSSADVTCPSAMTDGAARLLARNVARDPSNGTSKKVFERAYEHLVSRDPEFAWTSGQWMTERVGGSDVRNTETQATLISSSVSSQTALTADTEGSPLGPWSITGFKWFSSATDANMTILLARDPNGSISTFYAPLRRTAPSASPIISRATPTNTEPNGIQIQRLKTKLGTRPLPTAELVLNDTRAYMLGQPGHGTREISTILNITRVHNAVSAVGFWGRGLAISRAFSRVRRVGDGNLLMDIPAHVRHLADLTVDYAGMMHLTYFVVLLLGVSERGARSHQGETGDAQAYPQLLLAGGLESVHVSHLLRLLTPVAKAITALASIASLSSLVESLGGVGYIDDPADPETNVARLLRDAQVLSIWEGTTDVMAADVVRVLKGRDGGAAMQALEGWVRVRLERRQDAGSGDETSSAVRDLVQRARDEVRRAMEEIGRCVEVWDAERLKYQGRELLRDLGWVVSAVVLVDDAKRDGDAVAVEITRRWLQKAANPKLDSSASRSIAQEHAWDRRIVFGGSRDAKSPVSRL